MLTTDEKRFIQEAAQFLENPNWMVRLATKIGQPIEFIEKKLPKTAKATLSTITRKALGKALATAIKTLPGLPPPQQNFPESLAAIQVSHQKHTALAIASGTLGGLGGLLTLPIELPVTTMLMLRSIAETAHHLGADLSRPENQLECLYVFSLGSRANYDDATDTSYYASRLALAQIVDQAAHFVAHHSIKEVARAIEKGTAPVLVRFIGQIAARFEITVGEKVLSGAIPILGALGGGAINAAFLHHFNEAAKFHFGLKKLEERHGRGVVEAAYRASLSAARR